MNRRWMSLTVLMAGVGCASGETHATDGSETSSAADVGASMVDAMTPAPDAAMASSDGGKGLVLLSSAVDADGIYPQIFTCDGAGISPPLAWTGVPTGTAEFALLMTTLARDGLKWNWVLYHIPAQTTELAADSMAVGVSGLTSDGPLLKYYPPCSQGPGAKTYTFTLFALSSAPTFAEAPNRITGAVVTPAIGALTLGQAELVVRYTRP